MQEMKNAIESIKARIYQGEEVICKVKTCYLKIYSQTRNNLKRMQKAYEI